MRPVFAAALTDLERVVERLDPDEIEAACVLIAKARRIVCYGCGREALQVRGFAMRQHHLGLDVAMQGDMTTPPVGRGDVLLVSAGPGELATVTALMGVAKAAGADVLFLTAEPATPSADLASLVLTIPAQTMFSDKLAPTSTLPMGSVYEGALFFGVRDYGA